MHVYEPLLDRAVSSQFRGGLYGWGQVSGFDPLSLPNAPRCAKHSGRGLKSFHFVITSATKPRVAISGKNFMSRDNLARALLKRSTLNVPSF